ncbi:MAG: hypothetical protein NVS4B8_23660 [Herpetosiphon sp.]
MPALPVHAIFGGMQIDGHWAGTPALVIRLMEHPDTEQRSPDEGMDGAYPMIEWDFDPANEVTLNGLLGRRIGSGPQFASVGAATLSSFACSYRERHILIVGREPGRHDIEPLVRLLVAAGRHVQIETTGQTAIAADHAWVTLRLLPAREPPPIAPEIAARANDVLACIRWKSDLDRVEQLFANRPTPVWLRPSMFADPGVYRQCLAVAVRHAGWRVTRANKPLTAEAS